ncbi:29011_t:CDS:2 [Gigaspora margarita]|uniref:29011_t:CDS:1 n=1 Tax=Gigaspora margarita TaxID=4874 RepID=A0ABN7V8I5_GIGMA|nr:29011_t:CDS:2 [Gigaspora margarita]
MYNCQDLAIPFIGGSTFFLPIKCPATSLPVVAITKGVAASPVAMIQAAHRLNKMPK